MIVRAGAPKPRTIEELLSPALLARLERLDVKTRKVFAGKLLGERRSKQRGRSVEFADYREYAPGDDIRFIDWNVYARMDRLFVKLFHEEQDLAVQIALDLSPSMEAGWTGDGGIVRDDERRAEGRATGRIATGLPSKALFAQRLALALGAIGLINHNRVSLTVFRGPGGGVERLGELRGRRHVQRLASFVVEEARREESTSPSPVDAAHRHPLPGGEGAAQRGAGDFTGAMRAIASTRRGKGVMVVISDFLFHEGYEAGLRYLGAGLGREAGAGDAFDTYCVQVLSPAEIDPTVEARGIGGGGGERSGAARGGSPPGGRRGRGGGGAFDAGLAGDVRLSDIETGHGAEVTVSAALIKRYRQRLDEHISRLAAYCASRRMTHTLVQSDAEVDKVVMETLRRKGLVG